MEAAEPFRISSGHYPVARQTRRNNSNLRSEPDLFWGACDRSFVYYGKAPDFSQKISVTPDRRELRSTRGVVPMLEFRL